MVRRRAPPAGIIVPRRSPRTRLKEAIRTVEQDDGFSATKEEFDFDELPDSPELPLRQLSTPSPPNGLLNGHNDQASTFRRIVEDDYTEELGLLFNDSNIHDDAGVLFGPRHEQAGYNYGAHGYGDGCIPALPHRHSSASLRPSPPLSPISPLTNRYRHPGTSWRRMLFLFIMFIWMTYLNSKADGYYASIPVFRMCHAIVGVTFLAEISMSMPDSPYMRRDNEGLGARVWTGLCRAIILCCLLLLGRMLWIRNMYIVRNSEGQWDIIAQGL